MECDREYVVAKRRVGLWRKMVHHTHRESSQDPRRSAFVDQSKLPDTEVLKLDRPAIMPALSDAED